MNSRPRTGSSGTAVSSAEVRGHNLALVVADVRRHQPVTRAGISERTGLARASLTTMVPELLSAGLLRVAEAAPVPSGGRPVAALEFDGSRIAVVVVEITAGEVLVESIDLARRPVRLDRVAHPGPPGEPVEVVAAAATLVQAHLESLDSLGITFALAVVTAPTPLAGDPPLVIVSSVLRWGPVDLLGELTRRVPRLRDACLLVNDANMAALAETDAMEQRFGSRPADVVYLQSRNGIGGGVISGGRLLKGARGIGFEPAHLLVRPGGQPCPCGRGGCFVAEAGPEAVLADAGLGESARGVGVHAALAELVAGASRREPAVLAALGRAGRLIESIVVDLALAFDPAVVILGGYWADVLPELGVSPGLGLAEESALSVGWRTAGSIPPVVAGRLGEAATRLGAAGYAIDHLLRGPLHPTDFNH